MTFLATASGLIIDNVRSTAMCCLFPIFIVAEQRKSSTNE
jgi:hypothetical protein